MTLNGVMTEDASYLCGSWAFYLRLSRGSHEENMPGENAHGGMSGCRYPEWVRRDRSVPSWAEYNRHRDADRSVLAYWW